MLPAGRLREPIAACGRAVAGGDAQFRPSPIVRTIHMGASFMRRPNCWGSENSVSGALPLLSHWAWTVSWIL